MEAGGAAPKVCATACPHDETCPRRRVNRYNTMHTTRSHEPHMQIDDGVAHKTVAPQLSALKEIES